MNFGGGDGPKKAWKDIWGCGQGIGAVEGGGAGRRLVARLRREYEAARGARARRLAACARHAVEHHAASAPVGSQLDGASATVRQ